MSDDRHTISQLGAERLLQIANDIELTGQFNYGSWFTDQAPDGDGVQGEHCSVSGYTALIEGVASGECGTFACVAGWALTHMVQTGELSADDAARSTIKAWEPGGIMDLAGKHLELGSRWDAHNLFMGGAWWDMHDMKQPWSAADPDERPTYWCDISAVEGAKMLRLIASGDHPTWEVV